MCSPVRLRSHDPTASNKEHTTRYVTTQTYIENGSQFTRTIINVAGRKLSSLTRRDPDLDTTWTIEHLLKSTDDVEAYLQLPDEVFAETFDIDRLIEADMKLGDKGIIMVDTDDPICAAAVLFAMEDFTIIALTEQKLFHRLLEKHAHYIHARTEKVAKDFPGHLWRIYGPEFATEPYLPPNLFDEYVVRYTGPMVQTIKKYGGIARIHSHGRIKNILPKIIKMGADAIDPVEPPPQGNVLLRDVRREYGKDLVLFGNLEIADIENMESANFEKVVEQSLHDGTAGSGRGFVLMPSSAPYGRVITKQTMKNYETMVRLAEKFGHLKTQ